MATIDTKLGKIRGIAQAGIDVFLGVRFAQAPVGERRFRPPAPVGAWDGIYDATEYGHRAPQVDSGITSTPNGTLDEDCLFLNIYTPAADNASRPVLFWIHGGAFTMGSANQYDGTVLAKQGDVVVVAINHRLGLPGFLDLSGYGEAFAGSASNGIADSICALQWVRDNIADYGGDLGNVTIFGESAGGAVVNCVLSAPSGDGLYHRAISHSGGTPSTPPADVTKGLAAHIGIEPESLLDHLMELSWEDLLALQTASGVSGTGSSIDGTVVTRTTPDAFADRRAAGVPYIAGSNKDEGTLFSSLAAGENPDHEQMLNTLGMVLARSTLDGADPADYVGRLRTTYPNASHKELYEHIWNDMFRRASINNCLAATDFGAGGWLYRFDLPSTFMGGNLGATHASEIAFTFNSFAGEGPVALGFHDGKDPVVRDLAERWSNTVLAFARTGNPNGAGLPDWPQYEDGSRQSIVLDAESYTAGPDLDAGHRALWGDT